MFWPLSFYRLIYPKERYIWTQVRILHETEKAILIDNDMKIWERSEPRAEPYILCYMTRTELCGVRAQRGLSKSGVRLKRINKT